MTLALTISLALVAGMAIPAGALVSSIPSAKSVCLQHDIDSFVSYFGGGALLAAIAFVLLPYGIEHVSVLSTLIFDDIAPRAHLKHRDFPAIGAVSGFLLGMVGTMSIH